MDLQTPVKNSPRRSSVLALLLILLSTVGSSGTVAQKTSGGSKLVVSVTVPPICTVAVSPGQMSPTDAIAVSCRNLPESHPLPVVTEARPETAAPVITGTGTEVADMTGGPADSLEPVDSASLVAMVVINF
jgi:hypothetical protein